VIPAGRRGDGGAYDKQSHSTNYSAWFHWRGSTRTRCLSPSEIRCRCVFNKWIDHAGGARHAHGSIASAGEAPGGRCAPSKTCRGVPVCTVDPSTSSALGRRRWSTERRTLLGAQPQRSTSENRLSRRVKWRRSNLRSTPWAIKGGRLVTFRVSRRRRACLSVCLSAAACLHCCTDPDVTWESGGGWALVVHCWADLQSGHGLRCYGNITRTRNVSEYMLVLALCIVFVCNFVKDQRIFNAVFTVRFSDERYMWWYELHPTHLINVATLPCESQRSENVTLQ